MEGNRYRFDHGVARKLLLFHMRHDTFESVAGVKLREALVLKSDRAVELIVEGTWT